MCGVAAIRTYCRPVRADALERATSALAHRGPDSRRTWIAPHGLAGLGHQRLSIIDLSGGDQPLKNEASTVHAVVNGEFYGFEAIRHELEHRGHRFATRSDSEILVHLYEEYGIECLDWLRGEFAFALWDEATRRLYAVRDRFGIKPLVYAEHDGSLYVASEAKALFAAGVPAKWDPVRLVHQLLVYLNCDETLFQGVRQVPAGHYIEASNTGIVTRRYWDLDLPEGSVPELSAAADYVEELRWRIQDAVRIRLRADVPICSFLSGGLDSSVVCSLAASAGSELQAFTVAFPDAGFDEAALARHTAERSATKLNVISVGPREIAANLSDAAWHSETLGVNWHGVARYLLSREVHRAGFKVALSGEGADEVFAGYVQLRQDAGLAPANRNHELVAGLRSEFGFVPAWLEHLAVQRSVFWLLLDPGACDVTFEGAYRHFLSQFDWRDQLCGRAPLRQSMYLWTRSILPNYTLHAEKLEMAHAVETRPPFLDHELFEFARHIPTRLLITPTAEKHILREAARPFLSDAVYARGKHPFLAPPMFSQNGSELSRLAEETLRGRTMGGFPIFRKGEVASLLDRMPRLSEGQRARLDPALSLLMSACILQERLRLAW